MIDIQFIFPRSISVSNFSNLLGVKSGTERQLNDKDMIDFLIVIIFTEHFVVGLKVLLAEVINDEPSWVVKKMIQVNNKIEELNRSFKESEREELEKKLY